MPKNTITTSKPQLPFTAAIALNTTDAATIAIGTNHIHTRSAKPTPCPCPAIPLLPLTSCLSPLTSYPPILASPKQNAPRPLGTEGIRGSTHVLLPLDERTHFGR